MQNSLNSLPRSFSLVFGGGISGKAALAFLESRGETALLVDRKEGIIDSEENANQVLLPERVQKIIKSPGISPTHPWLEIARKRNIWIESEIDLGFSLFEGLAVGITGTDGKSTTTALTYHILSENIKNKSVRMGGNIGNAFTSFVSEKPDIAVLELSSYQLEDSHSHNCEISAILNLAPDHLERHKTMDNYAKAKSKITPGNNKDAIFIINQKTIPLVLPHINHFMGKILVFGKKTDTQSKEKGETKNYRFPSAMSLQELERNAPIRLAASIDPQEEWITTDKYTYNTKNFPLKGYHNLENLAVSILIGESLDIESQSIEDAYNRFNGLPHRFEKFWEKDGFRFVNDSKSTNLHSLISWLLPLDTGKEKLYLILGGRPKEEPLDRLLEILKQKYVKIFIIGEAASFWEKDFRDSSLDFHCMDNLKTAVDRIHYEFMDHPQSPGLVVLSPACASFDQYKNFEERGEHFRSLIFSKFSLS